LAALQSIDSTRAGIARFGSGRFGNDVAKWRSAAEFQDKGLALHASGPIL